MGGCRVTDEREGISRVPLVRLDPQGEDQDICRVVREETLSIAVEGIASYTLMWSPTRPRADAMGYTAEDGLLGEGELSEAMTLALGFLFTEGVIGGLGDLRSIAFCPDNPALVRVVLRDPEAVTVRRQNVVIGSSCGVCGEGEWFDALIDSLPEVGDGLAVTTDDLHHLMGRMRLRQEVFEATGGTHAAAVFDGTAQIRAFAEDLGRHNALDKVIGQCLLAGIETAALGVLLSSRLSLEMVSKAVRARFQLVAAVSAPTSLAITLAQRKRLTLAAFVRQPNCNVYAFGHRILSPARPEMLKN